jgi:hypothetical protein
MEYREGQNTVSFVISEYSYMLERDGESYDERQRGHSILI